MTATNQHQNVIDELVAHLNTAYGVPESEARAAFVTVMLYTWVTLQDGNQEAVDEMRERIQHG